MSTIPPKRRIPRKHDRVEVEVPGKGPHRAVVLYVETGMIVVATGTSKPDQGTEIVRIDRQPLFRVMRLRDDVTTHFFEEFIHPVAWDGGEMDIWGTTPAGVFNKLFDALERIAREALAGKRVIKPIPASAAPLVERLKQIAIPRADLHTPPPTKVPPDESIETARPTKKQGPPTSDD